MDLKNLFKKEYVVGLDIGSSSVKVAQFQLKEDGLCLVKTGIEEIGSIDDYDLRQKKTGAALKHLLDAINLRKSKVVAVINCPQTAIKKIVAPYMPPAELRQGIMLEAKNYFPFSIEESLLDLRILEDIIEKGIRKYEAIVAVSPHKTIEAHLSLLEKAGIMPVSLICTSCALQKIAENSYSGDNQTRCFIDIGELYTELVIAKGKYLMFSRKIPVAGSDFTKAMTGALVSDRGKTQLSFVEAEKIKKEIGLPAETESRIIDGKISTTQIMSMLRAPLEQLTSEIARSFDYCREESGCGRVDSVILFGAGASLTGLIKFLSEALGVEVKLGDALDGLKIGKDAVVGREKISYRLEAAVAGALNGTKGINLLPLKIKEEKKRTLKRTGFEAAAVAAILILTFIYTGMRITLTNLQKRISVAKIELASLEPQLNLARLYSLSADEPHWEDIFKEISNLISNDISLTDFSMQNKIVTIKGIVLSGRGQEHISDFVINLEKGIFKNVKLVDAREIKENNTTEFELRCWID